MKSLEPWNIEPQTQLSTREELLLEIARWGVLAASAHNAQPWRFVLDVKHSTIHVVAAGDRLLPRSDPDGRQTGISLGCALHNLEAAAQAYGLEPKTRLHMGNPNEDGALLGSVGLSGRPTVANEEWFAVARRRRINRSKYLTKAVESAQSVRLAACVVPGVTLTWVQQRHEVIALSELLYIADRASIARREFREEAAHYFVPSGSEATRGWPGHLFNLNDDAVARLVADLQRPGLFNPDWANGIPASGRDQLRSSPMVGILSVPEDNAVAWSRTGMAFQRLALQAEAEGLSVAVHGGLIESRGIRAMMQRRLGINTHPTMAFRLGTPSEDRGHAPRMRAEDVVESLGEVEGSPWTDVMARPRADPAVEGPTAGAQVSLRLLARRWLEP